MRFWAALGNALRTTSLIVGNTTILLVLCLLVGEWWARSMVPPSPETTTIGVLNQQGAYHPWSGYRNTPGFRYQLGDRPPTVINSWGWRGPEPKLARNPSIRRAILVGDSVAFACWGCRIEASLGGILKRALELRTNEEWEVIDTSVGAGFSSVSLGALTYDGMQFQPDVVVSLDGINDILVLDDRTMLRTGVGLFKHSIYHTSQLEISNIFDPRTGEVKGPGILDQLANKSALIRLIANSPFVAALGMHRPPAWTTPGILPRADVPYSTAHTERLDTYVNNELAMSYLAEGSGAKFVGFLEPYLSLKHKTLGDRDRAVIKTVDPALLTWADEVFPILLSKLEKAAAEHPSFHFVDLSLMFDREQPFRDLAHLHYETDERSAGYEQLAARMADEIVKVLYAGKELPDWRSTHVEGAPHDWNEQAYLAANPDVAGLIAEGKFKNGFEHYRSVGFLEFRHSGFPTWDEKAYLAANPDVAAQVAQGVFASGYEQYTKQGRDQGRRRGLPMRWTEEVYLAANPDVAKEVAAGRFASGQEQFMKAGVYQNRNGGFSGWDEEGYLIIYEDVRNAVLAHAFSSGFDHYLKAGRTEGRQISLGLP